MRMRTATTSTIKNKTKLIIIKLKIIPRLYWDIINFSIIETKMKKNIIYFFV